MTGIGKAILNVLRNSEEIDNNKNYEVTIMEKVPKMVKTDKNVLICLNCPEGDVCCFNCQDSDCIPTAGWTINGPNSMEAHMKRERPNQNPFIPAYIEAPYSPGKKDCLVMENGMCDTCNTNRNTKCKWEEHIICG